MVENKIERIGLGNIKEFEIDGGVFELPWGNIRVGRPWIAEITGLSDKYGFERRFINTVALDFYKGKPSKLAIDARHIEVGKIYEMKIPVSWGHPDERMCIHVINKGPDFFEAEEVTYKDILKYFNAKK
jgi:hypothetical protein